MKKMTQFLLPLVIILLFHCFIQAQTHFGPQVVLNPVRMANPVEQQWADLDGDGDLDCVVVSFWDETISWFENLGSRQFGKQMILSDHSERAEAIFISDLDNDGDMDIISGGRSTHKVLWFENTDGKATFSDEKVISYKMSVDDISVADMDQDGHLDIIAAFGSSINWFKNKGNEEFEPYEAISEYVIFGLRSIHVVDLNQDALPDVLFCSGDHHTVAWIENLGQGVGFSEIKEITTNINYPVYVSSADIDGDGDLDVLSASSQDNEINWYENMDGQGNFSSKNTVTTYANNASSVEAADLDHDGDLDLVSTGFYQVNWYQNLDGAGTFGPINYITAIAGGAKSGKILDIDQDGFLDITAAFSQDDELICFPGLDKEANFGEIEILAEATGNYPQDLIAADLDGDMAPELVVAFSFDDQLVQFSNPFARSGEIQVDVLDDQCDFPHSICTDDLNGDGWLDIVYASIYDASIRWMANDGTGGFSEPRLISENHEYRSFVRTIDFDLDGDRDLIYSDGLWGDLSISENIDGNASFAEANPIIGLPQFISTFEITDLEEDEIEELLVITNGNQVSLLTLESGRNFNPPQIILEHNSEINTFSSGDIDGDGFKEIVFADANNIAMLENENGVFTDTTTISQEISGVVSIALEDLDLDGDIELIVCSDSEDKVYWFENEGDFKSLLPPVAMDDKTVKAAKVIASDFNLDGYPDILSASAWDDKISWYQNKQLLNITQQPENLELCEFTMGKFEVDVNKEADFQWQIKKWNEVFFNDLEESPRFSGTKENVLTVDSVDFHNLHASQFRCKVYYQNDSLYSEAAVLNVVPTIKAFAGLDQYLCDSLGIFLNADDPWPGVGTWTCDQPDVVFVDSSFFGTPVSMLPFGTSTFYWEISHEFCPGANDTVQITVYEPLKIIAEPFDQELVIGETAQFTVETSGEVFQYQWFKNWEILQNNEQINGVTGNVLTIKEITPDNEGSYYCKLYGRCDTLETERATLSITTSLDRIQSAKIWIGPNPINQPADLIFHIPGIDPDKVICYNESGKVIEDFNLISKNDGNDQYTWTIQNLSPGIYYICFLTEKGTKVKKLIISH